MPTDLELKTMRWFCDKRLVLQLGWPKKGCLLLLLHCYLRAHILPPWCGWLIASSFQDWCDNGTLGSVTSHTQRNADTWCECDPRGSIATGSCAGVPTACQ